MLKDISESMSLSVFLSGSSARRALVSRRSLVRGESDEPLGCLLMEGVEGVALEVLLSIPQENPRITELGIFSIAICSTFVRGGAVFFPPPVCLRPCVIFRDFVRAELSTS